MLRWHTLKNVMVEPPLIVPYLISVCLARSAADSMGDFMRSIVRNEVKFAVYVEMMISVKNHQVPLTIRVDGARGPISQPDYNVVITIIIVNITITRWHGSARVF